MTANMQREARRSYDCGVRDGRLATQTVGLAEEVGQGEVGMLRHRLHEDCHGLGELEGYHRLRQGLESTGNGLHLLDWQLLQHRAPKPFIVRWYWTVLVQRLGLDLLGRAEQVLSVDHVVNAAACGTDSKAGMGPYITSNAVVWCAMACCS